MNVRGLDCVTSGHAHIYTARRTGEVIDTRHPLQLRTSTRGFHNTVELQQAMSRPYPRKASAEEAAWQQARVVRSRLGHNGEVAAARRAAARAGCFRTMAASPCASMPQQRAELTRHTGEFHAPVHGKKSESHPLASKPAIKKSRRNCAAKPRRGRVAVQRRSRPRRVIQSGHGKRCGRLAQRTKRAEILT